MFGKDRIRKGKASIPQVGSRTTTKTKINLSIMSKIIYRKIRTAPGVKQYLDEEKTQVNPQFEANSAYFAQAVTLETLSLRDMAKHRR